MTVYICQIIYSFRILCNRQENPSLPSVMERYFSCVGFCCQAFK